MAERTKPGIERVRVVDLVDEDLVRGLAVGTSQPSQLLKQRVRRQAHGVSRGHGRTASARVAARGSRTPRPGTERV